MKNLLIVGARGFGREVYDMVKDCQGYGRDFMVKGFLDDKKDALDGFDGYPPIISSLEDYLFSDEDVFSLPWENLNGDVTMRGWPCQKADRRFRLFIIRRISEKTR